MKCMIDIGVMYLIACHVNYIAMYEILMLNVGLESRHCDCVLSSDVNEGPGSGVSPLFRPGQVSVFTGRATGHHSGPRPETRPLGPGQGGASRARLSSAALHSDRM